MEEAYRKQVELLLRCLPEIDKQSCFALKGGTAINLFVRNMPRLSIDIDLVYLPVEPREETLSNINNSLSKISNDIERHVAGVKVLQDNKVTKLYVEHNGARIKIEPNTVQRGAVFEVEELSLCERTETEFEASVTVKSIAVPELYGSKIVAALDRQHPRDLFDVKLLLEDEGFTDDIRKAFVVYLASHSRPMSELLNPNLNDIEQAFDSQFQGMTNIAVELDDLLETREQLIRLVNEDLTQQERRFLLSVKSGVPDWSLMDIPNVELLPAIQWKLQNIRRIDKVKHLEAIDKLRKVLGL